MINITSYPQDFLPIYNNYIYSTQSSFYPNLPANYRAICDVYINDNKVGTLKSYPNKDGYNFFRLDRICQDYFSFDIHDEPNFFDPFYINPNSVKNIKGLFYEEYGDLSTGTTIYTANTVTGDTLIAFNGAIPWIGDMSNNYNPQVKGTGFPVVTGLNFTNYWPQSYIAQDGIPGVESLFMTYAPRTLKMNYTDTYYLNILTQLTDVLYKLDVRTYDSDGNLITSETWNNSYNVVTLTGATSETVLQSIGIGPLDINTLSLNSTGAPLINADVSYYTIQGLDFYDYYCTEKFKVVMNTKKYYQKFRFRWLNSLGGFDSYTFEGRNSPTKNVRNSTEFTKLFGYENIFGEYQYPNGDRGRKNIYQSVETQYTVFSQFITEAESYWLNELFTSPEVYLEVIEDPKEIASTFDWLGSGLLGISYNTPHLYTTNALLCIIDCNDSDNNQYAGVNIIDDFNIGLAALYAPITNGLTFTIDGPIKLLPIIINSKTYNIKQGINPRNIQVQIDFTLALEDPKQRG